MSQYILFSLVPSNGQFPIFSCEISDQTDDVGKQKWKIQPISILRTNPNLPKCNSLLNSP